MYHKNGNVDIELLTDIGYIAQGKNSSSFVIHSFFKKYFHHFVGLRSQELLWTQIQFKDLHKVLIKSWHKHDNDDDPAFPNAVALLIARLDELITTETESVVQTDEVSVVEREQNTIAKVRLLEEKLIEFYNQQQAELKRLEQQEHNLKYRRPIRSTGDTENLLYNMNNTSTELNTSKNIETISSTTAATSTTTTTFNNNNNNSNKNRNNNNSGNNDDDDDEEQIIVSTKNGTTNSPLQTDQSIINLNQSTDTNTSEEIIKIDNRPNDGGDDTLQQSIKCELIGDGSTTKTAAEQQQQQLTVGVDGGRVSPVNTTPKCSPKPTDKQLSFSLTNDVIFVEKLTSNESSVSIDGGANQSGASIESDLTSMSDEDTEKLKKLNCDFSQFSDDDLKMLIKELRKKIEFTERLNWLCE
jgi:hypothetical protein